MGKSSGTMQRIIAVAIQEIANEDIYHRIRLERIAEKAGVSEATIHYHFGRKEDFSKAVWEKVLAERKPYSLPYYYEQNRDMLKTPAGQRKFLSGMVRTYCSFFHSPKSEYLRKVIRLFFIENIGLAKEPRKHVRQYFQTELNAFLQICREITGVDDPVKYARLFLFIMHPLTIACAHPVNPSRNEIPITMEQYEELVMEHANVALCFHLGLGIETEKIKTPEPTPARKSAKAKK